MGEWFANNSGVTVTATVGLVIAFLTVSTAEGGRRRRLLRQIKEELEVLGKLDEQSAVNDVDTRARFVAVIEDNLSTYGVNAQERRRRLARRVYLWSNLLLPALVLAGGLWGVDDDGNVDDWVTEAGNWIGVLIFCLFVVYMVLSRRGLRFRYRNVVRRIARR